MLGFQPAAEAAEGREPPVEVSDLTIVRRFRAIADPGGAGDHWTQEEQRRFEPACAASGPVLGPGSNWFGGAAAAHGFTAGEAAFAIRAYRQAIAEAASGALPPIDCVDDPSRGVPPICADPPATLASLSPDGPLWFDMAPCADGAGPLCVTVTVPRNIDGLGWQRQIRVAIRTDAGSVYPRPRTINVASVSLSAGTIVY